MSAAASKLELEGSPRIVGQQDLDDLDEILASLPPSSTNISADKVAYEDETTHERDHPDHAEHLTKEEEAQLEKLLKIDPPEMGGPVIALDLDDVLSQTNRIVAEWHNESYGTKMDLSQFYYYYYWKNPFWGTPLETFHKVQAFYDTPRIFETLPVPGAQEGVTKLKALGFKLVIVTARSQDVEEHSWKWLQEKFPGMFDSVICTGQFKDASTSKKAGHEVTTRLSKAQVCADLKAQLLIDDSLENAMQCASASPPIPVLLFGDYEWNKRLSGHNDATDEMTFTKRYEGCGRRQFWEEENVRIISPPKGNKPIWRVKDWEEVVSWVERAIEEGKVDKPKPRF